MIGAPLQLEDHKDKMTDSSMASLITGSNFVLAVQTPNDNVYEFVDPYNHAVY